MEAFPTAHTQFLSPSFSDHYPIITHFGIPPIGSSGPFRFLNFLTKNHLFLTVVKDSWLLSSFYGCKSYILTMKLKALKPALRKLNRECYSNIHIRLEEEKHKIHMLQLDNLTSPQLEVQQSELKQEKVANELALAEELFLLQKSHIKWLKEGDRNTAFFHKSVTRKQFKDQIKFLIDSNGAQLTSNDDISAEVVRFYQAMLGSVDLACSGGSLADLRDLLAPVPLHLTAMLTISPTCSDIAKVFKTFPSNKAPGPDGFTVEFFKSAWSIVGVEVVQAIQEFFIIGKLLKSLNSTWITLVPKCPNPSMMTNFRPISCCNVLYKCITKILANRLQICLPPSYKQKSICFCDWEKNWCQHPSCPGSGAELPQF